MSLFKVSQKVVAQVEAQGMKKGKQYEVVGVKVFSAPFGDFVTYTLSDDGRLFTVENGHLLLEPFKPEEDTELALCPICGEEIEVVGETTNGRLIGSCGDAFTRRQWEYDDDDVDNFFDRADDEYQALKDGDYDELKGGSDG